MDGAWHSALDEAEDVERVGRRRAADDLPLGNEEAEVEADWADGRLVAEAETGSRADVVEAPTSRRDSRRRSP